MPQYTLAEIAEKTGATLQGDGSCIIHSIAPLEHAQAGQISFLDNLKYRKWLVTTAASAVIINPKHAEECPVNALLSHNPYYTHALVTALFDPAPSPRMTIHPSAVIAETAEIAENVSVGANAVIGEYVKLAEGVVIGAGCVVDDGAQIGAQTRLYPNVTIYHGVQIGKRCVIQSGAVIGSDGFGFANEKGQWHRVRQIGSVVLGDDVDVGANTTIDRGAIANTEICNGAKVDNLVQIAHNVKIGEHTAIAGCVGIAGSTTIGKYCLIGGGVGISGHLTIGDQVFITAFSGVGSNLTEPGAYSSGLEVMPAREWNKQHARFRQLDKIARSVKQLEKALAAAATESE